MGNVLHITSGDIAGGRLEQAGFPGKYSSGMTFSMTAHGSQAGRRRRRSTIVRCFWRPSPRAV
ncbi:hypothetical protein [Desulfosarcina cetonica]|uniref:hypothetical protein n=1 Tax=Desulfosarcina cetonica TaxID=90730 RepID=UPI001FEDCA1A|nr:hypothetical protein [Desulfosarcina cetonica]